MVKPYINSLTINPQAPNHQTLKPLNPKPSVPKSSNPKAKVAQVAESESCVETWQTTNVLQTGPACFVPEVEARS